MTKIIFGIQGGKGSFNQQALIEYTSRNNIDNFQTKYLYTTERVLFALKNDQIDFGLFAIQNSTGGMV